MFRLLVICISIHISHCVQKVAGSSDADSIAPVNIAQSDTPPPSFSEDVSKLARQFGDTGIQIPVEEIKGPLNPVTFFEAYAKTSIPLKMTNSAKSSPAFDLWKFDDYFLSLNLSDHTVNVETRKKEDRSQKTVDMHFQDFVKIYNDTNQYMVSGLPDFLGVDVLLPWELQCKDMIESNIVESIMWFSSGGTKSVVHTDSVDNLNCVFSGNKTFILVDPRKYWENVPIDHPEGAYSSINVDNVDLNIYPGLEGIEYYHVNLTTGDCLFIPYRWIHQVRSYGRSIAVNIWWDYFSNEHLDLTTCYGEMDSSITMAEVNYIGFDSIMNSPNQLRDQFKEYSRGSSGFTFDKLKAYLLHDVDSYKLGEGIGYTLPIKQIIKVLDIDLNGHVILNEVLAAPDEAWEHVADNMERFLSTIDHAMEQWERAQEQEPFARDEL